MEAYPVLKSKKKRMGELDNVIRVYNPLLGEYYLYQAVSRMECFPYLIVETDCEFGQVRALVRVLLKMGVFKKVETEDVTTHEKRVLRFVLVKHDLLG